VKQAYILLLMAGFHGKKFPVLQENKDTRAFSS